MFRLWWVGYPMQSLSCWFSVIIRKLKFAIRCQMQKYAIAYLHYLNQINDTICLPAPKIVKNGPEAILFQFLNHSLQHWTSTSGYLVAI